MFSTVIVDHFKFIGGADSYLKERAEGYKKKGSVHTLQLVRLVSLFLFLFFRLTLVGAVPNILRSV